MRKGQVTFEVLVNGKPIKEYLKNGEVWVEGRKGSEYTLRVTNNTNKRILAVPTVDGLSVMDGKLGSHASGGYILDAYETATIPGWRLNNDKVAKFVFAAAGESYAAKTQDQPNNIGVIGCAFFNEYRPPVFRHDVLYSRGPSLTFGGFNSAMFEAAESIEKGIGTGFGDVADHHVTTARFERASSTPFIVATIRYANRAGLIAAGVNLRPTPVVANPGSANPFPGSPGTGCKPPLGWQPQHRH